MAALTGTTIAAAGGNGSLAAPAAMSVADTIDDNYVGYILAVTNGSGSSVNFGFTDPGLTPAGNTGTEAPVAIAAAATRRWRLTSQFVNPSTGVINTTLSLATSVTYELYK